MLTRADNEIIDFIAASSPQAVVDYQPSQEAKDRVADLVSREKMASLSPQEASELQSYLHLERIMRLAKARARRLLAAP